MDTNVNENNFAEIIDLMNKSYKINDPELAFALYYELYNRLLSEIPFRFEMKEYPSFEMEVYLRRMTECMTVVFRILIDRVNKYKNKNCGAVQLIKIYVSSIKTSSRLSQEDIAILDDFVANIQEIKSNIISHNDFQIVKNAHINQKTKMEILKQLYTYLTNIRKGLSETTNKEYLTIIMEEIETTISSKLEEYIALFNYDNTINIEEYLKEDVKNILMDYISEIGLLEELNEELNKLNIQLNKDELAYFKIIYICYISGCLKNNGYLKYYLSISDKKKIIKELSDNLNISKLQLLILTQKVLLIMLKVFKNSLIDLFKDDTPTDSITR